MDNRPVHVLDDFGGSAWKSTRLRIESRVMVIAAQVGISDDFRCGAAHPKGVQVNGRAQFACCMNAEERVDTEPQLGTTVVVSRIR
ncbi:hypothetical protein S40288_10737 [Stachybotrys chartarum IBT 40288]|nr:hypothetical protein S40288_10737 [Stachybotrys chartarum IBT 40288]